MLFLIVLATTVNCEEDASFQSFVAMIINSFAKYEDEEFPHKFLQRNMNDLASSIITMDNSNELSQYEILKRAKEFDRFDIIFLFAPKSLESSLPWQGYDTLLALVKMCLQTKKPVLSTGFCSILYTYSITAISAFSDVFNADIDCHAMISYDLSNQSFYYDLNKITWIDKTNGDVFGFDISTMTWTPLGNIGMQLPDNTRRKSFHQGNNCSEDYDDDYRRQRCEINHRCKNHPLLKKIPQAFTCQHNSGSWTIAYDNPLVDIGFSALIVDASTNIPLVMEKDNCLLIMLSIEQSFNQSSSVNSELDRICHNYIREMSRSLLTTDKQASSLTQTILGTLFFVSDLISKSSLLKPPISSLSVPTTLLPNGPLRRIINTDTKGFSRLIKVKAKDTSKFPVRTIDVRVSKPQTSTRVYKFQDPCQSRSKRLECFLANEDYTVPTDYLASCNSITQVSISPESNLYSTSFDSCASDHKSVLSTSRSAGVLESTTSTVCNEIENIFLDDVSVEESSLNARMRSTQRTITLLSLDSTKYMSNKQRPVSASVLQTKLPLNHPLSNTAEPLSVVVRDNVRQRPFSAYKKYETMRKADAINRALNITPIVAIKPPVKLPVFEGPRFSGYFGGTSDLIARKPAYLGQSRKVLTEEVIHANCDKLFVYGPWK